MIQRRRTTDTYNDPCHFMARHDSQCRYALVAIAIVLVRAANSFTPVYTSTISWHTKSSKLRNLQCLTLLQCAAVQNDVSGDDINQSQRRHFQEEEGNNQQRSTWTDISPSSDYYLRFAGVGRLYARRLITTLTDQQELLVDDPVALILDRLSKATVVIVGLGGVGSWAAEALCRSGIGHLVLIDLDDICISNTNRQIHAVTGNIGQMKIDAMKHRLQLINPSCKVTTVLDFVSPDNVHEIIEQFCIKNEKEEMQQSTTEVDSISSANMDSTSHQQQQPLIVLDAIDSLRDKVALIKACVKCSIPVVTVGGAGGVSDPTQIKVEDMARVQGDRLLFLCRKELRQNHNFKKSNLSHPKRPSKVWNIPAVFSDTKTDAKSTTRDTSEQSNFSSLRACDSYMGTACFATGTFGFFAASRIVDMIAMNEIIYPTATTSASKRYISNDKK